MNKTLVYLVAVLSTLGLIFNIVQIIIIINGGFNRNPAIQPEWLQTLDAIGLTLAYAVVSLLLLLASIWQLRRNEKR